MEHGLDLIIVDYLQLITVGDGGNNQKNRVQEVSEITGDLKALAKELSGYWNHRPDAACRVR